VGGPGSRKEDASNKKLEPPFRFNRNGKGFGEPERAWHGVPGLRHQSLSIKQRYAADMA